MRYALETAREQHAEVIVYLTVPIGEDWFPSSEGPKRVDMIIKLTHGRTGLSHILIGSVTKKVVERAPCPVLVACNR